MKSFLFRHPAIASICIFISVILVGSIVGWIVGALFFQPVCRQTELNDPCDGQGLVILTIFYGSLAINFVLAFIASLVSYVWLNSRK